MSQYSHDEQSFISILSFKISELFTVFHRVWKVHLSKKNANQITSPISVFPF